jgi:cytochrome c556
MGALMSAVMILDYVQVQSRATSIVEDVSLARPLTGDATELNSALPEKFFSFQDQLRTAAKALASAAADKSAFAVADAYGHVSETCVKCHAVYRQGRPPG